MLSRHFLPRAMYGEERKRSKVVDSVVSVGETIPFSIKLVLELVVKNSDLVQDPCLVSLVSSI